MNKSSEEPENKPEFTVQDKRFWARKETGLEKEGERPPRKSDYPTVVEQLQAQMEASREKLKKRLEEIEQEKSAFRQRLSAEMERRLERDKLEIVKVLLEVMDNLDVAIQAEISTGGDITPLMKGIKVIRDDIWARIRKFDIEKVKTTGQHFDPEIHEAVMTKPCQADQDGLVLEEVQAGYKSGEYVIRAAKVVVGATERE